MEHLAYLSGHELYMNRPFFASGVRTINVLDPADIARHDRMVALVTQILDPTIRNCRMRGSNKERTMLYRQIDVMDGAIDRLVYELYGLTEEEIAIVQGSVK